jgi:hypothetical protein
MITASQTKCKVKQNTSNKLAGFLFYVAVLPSGIVMVYYRFNAEVFWSVNAQLYLHSKLALDREHTNIGNHDKCNSGRVQVKSV